MMSSKSIVSLKNSSSILNQDLDDILDTRYFQFGRDAPMSRRPSCQRSGSNNSLLVNFFANNSKKDRKLSRTNSDSDEKIVVGNIYCRYKTELCRPFKEKGECKYGNKCQFAHGAHELRCTLRHPKYKTEPCHKFHTTGFCNYGPRCTYIHNEEDDEMSGKVSSLSSEPSSSPSSFGSISPPPYAANTAFSFAPLVRLPSSSSSSDSNYTESRTSSPLSFEGKEYNNFGASPYFSFQSLRNQLMT
ncbi:hypothetical protein M8J76_007514 [Diaphorina citri]|nr:hypothetical protein M8J75_001962 [Diaphorina citri]KAI5726725.1 hypothetical protein M8J76_007514 [Diaphorina citri]KAI5731755.1 hypothetical protein M8J77_015516 [Diaphorina citri]